MSKSLAKRSKFFKSASALLVLGAFNSLSNTVIADDLKVSEFGAMAQKLSDQSDELIRNYDLSSLDKLAKETSDRSVQLQQSEEFKEQVKPWSHIAKEKLMESVGSIADKEAEAIDNALYGNSQTVVIAISQNMGDAALRELMKLSSSNSERVLLVVRGLNEGQSFTQLTQKLHAMAREFDPVPNIEVNPIVFKEFGVTAAPTTLVIDREVSDVAEETKKLLFKVEGVTNLAWVDEQMELGKKGDQKRQGEVVEISERDLIEIMKQRASEYDWQTVQKEMPNRFWKQLPDRYADFPAAQEDRIRYLKPIVYAQQDIKDGYGNVIVEEGTTINSLEKRQFNKAMIIFDASNEIQLEWLEQKLKSGDLGNKLPVLIATKFPNVAEGEDGFEKYADLTDRLDEHVYLIQKEIVDTFFIENIPTIVTANNNDKYFIIEEYAMTGATSNEQ